MRTTDVEEHCTSFLICLLKKGYDAYIWFTECELKSLYHNFLRRKGLSALLILSPTALLFATLEQNVTDFALHYSQYACLFFGRFWETWRQELYVASLCESMLSTHWLLNEYSLYLIYRAYELKGKNAKTKFTYETSIHTSVFGQCGQQTDLRTEYY